MGIEVTKVETPRLLQKKNQGREENYRKFLTLQDFIWFLLRVAGEYPHPEILYHKIRINQKKNASLWHAGHVMEKKKTCLSFLLYKKKIIR